VIEAVVVEAVVVEAAFVAAVDLDATAVAVEAVVLAGADLVVGVAVDGADTVGSVGPTCTVASDRGHSHSVAPIPTKATITRTIRSTRRPLPMFTAAIRGRGDGDQQELEATPKCRDAPQEQQATDQQQQGPQRLDRGDRSGRATAGRNAGGKGGLGQRRRQLGDDSGAGTGGEDAGGRGCGGAGGVVSRERVLGVVFSFGGRVTVRLVLVRRVGGCTGMLLGLVFSFGGRGTVRLALVRVGGCTGMLLGLVFSFGGRGTVRLVLVRVLVPGVPVGPEPGAVEVLVGPPAVLVAGVLLLLLLPEGWAQSGVLMVLLSRVTAAVCASRRPVTVAPVCAVTEARASTVPTKVEWVPRVAELPTCQKTLQDACEVVNLTTLPEPVIKVLEAWKMNTASGAVELSSVTVPVRLRFPW